MQQILETATTGEAWLDHTSYSSDEDDDSRMHAPIQSSGEIALHNDEIPSSALMPPVDNNNKTWPQSWTDRFVNEGAPYIVYVHVGKTGGITLETGVPIPTTIVTMILQCIVKQQQEQEMHGRTNFTLNQTRTTCWNKHYVTSKFAQARKKRKLGLAQITRHVLAHKHLYSQRYKPHEMLFAMQHLDTFLITTRNPVDRIVSAFNYHRNEYFQVMETGTPEKKRVLGGVMKQVFYDCFPDVRYMAEELAHIFFRLHTPNSTKVYKQMTCGQLAFRLLSRTHPQHTPEWAHYTSNYRWYTKLTIDKRPDASLLVVRTEYLWEDTTKIEVALGGKKDSFDNAKSVAHSHGSEKYEVTAKLDTDRQKRAICCAIWDDLQAYQNIILNAINLNGEEKNEMMRLVWRDCGVEVDEYDVGILYSPWFWEVSFLRRNCNDVRSDDNDVI